MIERPQMLWAYLGPETTLPLASALGALIGVLLMFWHFIVGVVTKPFRMLFKKERNDQATDAPHSSSTTAAASEDGRTVSTPAGPDGTSKPID